MNRAGARSVPALCTALVMLAVTGCAGLGDIDTPPRVTLVDLRPIAMTLFEQRYLARLRVRNPNDVPLEVTGMDYTIDINDQKFADGVNNERFTVPPYGESVVEVTLISSLLRLIDQFRRLDQRGKLVIDYRISGRMSVAGLPARFPFSHEDSLELSPSRGSGKAL